MNIYIGQLPYSVKEDELREIFSEYGEIASLKLVTDRFSGQSKGFGFIDMPNNSEADKAIKALNGCSYHGKLIKVNQVQAKTKSSRPKRRRRY